MDFSLDDRYRLDEGTVYLTGIQALVRTVRDRALLDRRNGLRTASFVSGYEGSPLAGYDLELARRKTLLDEVQVVHRPGVNEEIAATSVMGSQLTAVTGTPTSDGVTGYWYGKAPGLDRATDAIRHANLIGTSATGGAVAFVGDDPAGKSSSLACASEFALADMAIPTLFPADQQDVLDFGLHAAFLSRLTGLWSALKIVTAVADGSSTVTVSPDRITPTFGDLVPPHRPEAHLLGPNLLKLERSTVSQRVPLAIEYARLNDLDRVVISSPHDRIGVVAAGKTYLDVRESLARLGLDDTALREHGVRLLKVGMVWPLDPQRITEFAAGLDELIVVEEKRPFLEKEIRALLFGIANPPTVVGKSDVDGRELVSPVGELDVDQVTKALARRLSETIPSARTWLAAQRGTRLSLPLLPRTPYFCSGCPHNSSTKVPADTLVGAGIGCHAMVLFMDEKQVGDVVGLTQMGGEGAQWLGMAPFLAENHFIQNLGDGTFAHSGSLAVRAAVAAGENITFKLLYNSAVAMTGGQDPAGGLTLGQLVRLLRAEGVAKVVVTTEDARRVREQRLPADVAVHERGDVVRLQQELARVPGVTVLVHDQECAAEKRRGRKRGKIETPATRVLINERVCEGCGDCGEKSNCTSVQRVSTGLGDKTRIHQSSCNVDYACLSGDCPSFVTVTPGTTRRRRTPVPDLDSVDLPSPPPGDHAGDFALRITGVGGTGVLTIAQIIATAAVIDGWFVRGVDQTGLAQKGGAVVSDLKITARPTESAAKLAARSCDLYLACDSLVGTDPVHLQCASPTRTVAVLSTSELPTGRMVADSSIRFPAPESLRGVLDDAVARVVALDTAKLATELFDGEQFANMILVGAAYQLGELPLTAAALEQAITLNGTEVARNIQAFRRGRHAVAIPESRQDIAAAELDLAADLAGYQSAAYSDTYIDFVAKVRAAEQAAVPGSTVLTESVATHLYRLMAYKDEYEVARLLLDEEFDAEVRRQFGEDATYRFRLHPPLLRALGLRRKLPFGRRWRPVFRLLHLARRVRGTWLDPFGRHPVRRAERRLISEYRSEIESLLPGLGAGVVVEDAVRIARLPELIRGYEQVKMANIDRYHAELARQRTRVTPRGATRAQHVG